MMVVLAFFILMLPGAAWLVWEDSSRMTTAGMLDWPSWLADAAGISLALVALVGLGTFLFGWRYSGWAVIWLYALVGLVSVFLLFQRRRDLPISSSQSLTLQSLISNLIPLLIFACLIAFRFYQARDLVLPAWVDSVHHTLIVRLFLETGGVPPTVVPYIDAPFYYHFGFHLNTALYAFFARLSPEQAVLIFGQVLNAFVSLTIYRLAIALWHDQKRAGIAMLLTGFVFQMPAYYLTWGRYTLLAGLALLILAMAATLDLIRFPADRGHAVRLALYVAGLLLTHYFAAGLLALFFVTLGLERMVFGGVRPWQIWKHAGLRMVFFAGLAGFLLASPWVWHVWDAGNRYFRVKVIAPTEAPDDVYFSGYLGYLWFLLGPYHSHVMAILGGVALFLAGWRTRTRPFTVWVVAFILLSLPWGLHIAPFRPEHGVIVAFFPAAMLIADAFVTPLEAGSRAGFRWLARGLVAVALIGLLVWGVKATRHIINPVTILANRAEVNALHWIDQNTPEDASFFINVAYWQSGSYRGVDGGWWIMPLTGRSTFLPPALYLFDAREDALAINVLGARAAEFKECSAEFLTFLDENALDYVYIGPNQGLLRPEALGNCPGLNVVYDQEGVMIYKVGR